MWLELTRADADEMDPNKGIFTQNMDKVVHIYARPRPYHAPESIRYVSRFRTANREYQRPTDEDAHGDRWFVYTVNEDDTLVMAGPGRVHYERCTFEEALEAYLAPDNQKEIDYYLRQIWAHKDAGWTELSVVGHDETILVTQPKKAITEALASSRSYVDLTGHANNRGIHFG
jgi:hypothetical protein